MQQGNTIQVRVKSIKMETETIKRFTLEAVNGVKLPLFGGGSHIITYLPQPSGIMERHYSVFNLSEPGVMEIAVRLAEPSNGGSAYWHHSVIEGDIVKISYPKNHFPMSFQAKHHVFYAAGIGITPFLSMMAELAEKNQSFELHYGAKTKEQCAFYNTLRERYPEECYFYFSEDENSNRLSPASLQDHRIGTHVYFCGPENMIEEFTETAKSYGYPSFNIHFERFAPPENREARPFTVTLQNSGMQLEIPKDRSLLDVIRENGINLPFSCKVGGCGTCEVKVAEGEVAHFDSFLTEEQQRTNQSILCFVSRGEGHLVLDL
ncbi:PDR/VanB family oxidoreductase [Cytobacillus oceanisediminis]|uniref:PDR/VanB family oxidoreductase n=1 Tax=Cytobacillus oceanisediminis TaxID=665099 RepID=UPI0021B5D84B|nr:PDR/VanB family oxidoreductase [Cytobacillus oceanisediminis]